MFILTANYQMYDQGNQKYGFCQTTQLSLKTDMHLLQIQRYVGNEFKVFCFTRGAIADSYRAVTSLRGVELQLVGRANQANNQFLLSQNPACGFLTRLLSLLH